MNTDQKARVSDDPSESVSIRVHPWLNNFGCGSAALCNPWFSLLLNHNDSGPRNGEKTVPPGGLGQFEPYSSVNVIPTRTQGIPKPEQVVRLVDSTQNKLIPS